MSKGRVAVDMLAPKEFLREVRCGACNKYLSVFPIYIDENNLALCGRCSEYVTEETKITRDLSYESLAKHFKFPCIYDVEGCMENLFPADVPYHEECCHFRIIPCPSECMWQGTVNDLLGHFEELHPNSILKNGEFEVNFLNSYELYDLMVFKDELFSFKRKFEYSDNTLECSFFCYKMLDSVTKYSYQIVVENGARNHSVKFPPKSADNFQTQNVTPISVERIKNKLNDPSIIIGTVSIFTEEEKTETGKPPKTVNPEINYDMLSELECPICMDYIIPPIYQCVTGHSICADCKENITECPTCKSEIKNTQNFTLEKMAYLLTYPCKFSEFGCDFASKPGKIKQHQIFCLHGPHTCPLRDYENCTWKDAAGKIYSHIVNAHHDNLLEIEVAHVFIDGNYFTTEDCTCYIMKFSDALFKLHYRYSNDAFCWSMQLIGPPEDAKKYKFEIDIIDNNHNNQRMFLRNFCSPTTDKSKCFQVPGQYTVIPLDQIRSFLTDILTYRVRIVV